MKLPLLLEDPLGDTNASMCLTSRSCDAADATYRGDCGAADCELAEDFESGGRGDGEGRGHGMWSGMPWEVD
jgi:hypothetical protein